MADWVLALAAVVGLAANVAVQVGMSRLVGLLRSVVVGFGAGLVVAVVVTLLAGRELSTLELAGQVAANGLIYFALGYGYFHFLNLGETARRVRILREFVDAGGTLTLAEVLQRYSGRDIVRVRLGRLQSKGQVVLHDGRYVIGKPTVQTMANMIGALGWLLLPRGKK